MTYSPFDLLLSPTSPIFLDFSLSAAPPAPPPSILRHCLRPSISTGPLSSSKSTPPSSATLRSSSNPCTTPSLPPVPSEPHPSCASPPMTSRWTPPPPYRLLHRRHPRDSPQRPPILQCRPLPLRRVWCWWWRRSSGRSRSARWCEGVC